MNNCFMPGGLPALFFAAISSITISLFDICCTATKNTYSFLLIIETIKIIYWNNDKKQSILCLNGLLMHPPIEQATVGA